MATSLQSSPLQSLTSRLHLWNVLPSQLKHALAGVEKGRKAGTAPVEIMGLMIGKASGESIVVLDACPLPVEGSETRVVADDAQVHMLELMDSMELRRKEGFVGWYHRYTTQSHKTARQKARTVHSCSILASCAYLAACVSTAIHSTLSRTLTATCQR